MPAAARHGGLLQLPAEAGALIPQHRRVSRVEILQHVIDYILNLQLALAWTCTLRCGHLPLPAPP